MRATRLGARVAELEARLAEHARTIEIQYADGATSTANWWAHATRQTRAGAHRVGVPAKRPASRCLSRSPCEASRWECLRVSV